MWHVIDKTCIDKNELKLMNDAGLQEATVSDY